MYPQLYYYDYLGSSYSEILRSAIQRPFEIIRILVQPPQLLAVIRVLLPFAFFLPFLHGQWVMLCVPYVLLMFLSSDIDMMQLDKWYTATIFPVLTAATAEGLLRLPKKKRTFYFWIFAAASIIAFLVFSPAPLGGRFDPQLYQITPRHRLERAVIALVPDSACVVAQKYYVPQLTHRMDLYHYPIYQADVCPEVYYLFDRSRDSHPADLRDIQNLIEVWMADPGVAIAAEAEDIVLFRRGGQPLPAVRIDATAEGAMHLDRVEIAAQNGQGIYMTMDKFPIDLEIGQGIRVNVYWEALAAPGAERSVSLRILDKFGTLVAQHDSMPGGGSKPTSWWQPGWAFRDIYYLTLPTGAVSGPAS
ncbi:MAG: DUF2079 domain-containing protein, partial [Anaerolineae bacterium]|nr:DUF2079 domain-containing protein [Anaerolineae bacterium]